MKLPLFVVFTSELQYLLAYSLAGCPEASICNIYRAVQAAQKQGSLGVIIAHWSGSFHLTPHPFSLPGFVVGAGLAWNASTHWVCCAFFSTSS